MAEEGGANMGFFHISPNVRRRSKQIVRLKVGTKNVLRHRWWVAL